MSVSIRRSDGYPFRGNARPLVTRARVRALRLVRLVHEFGPDTADGRGRQRLRLARRHHSRILLARPVTYVTRHHREAHVFRIFFRKGTSWFHQRMISTWYRLSLVSYLRRDSPYAVNATNDTDSAPIVIAREFSVNILLFLSHTHTLSAAPACCADADTKVRSVFKTRIALQLQNVVHVARAREDSGSWSSLGFIVCACVCVCVYSYVCVRWGLFLCVI